MSAVLGIENRLRCDTVMPCACPAALSQPWNQRWSPLAVPTQHSRGARPVTPDSSMACSTSALNSTSVQLPRRRPPEVARIVGDSAGMAGEPTPSGVLLASAGEPVPGDRLVQDLGEPALRVARVRLDMLAHALPRRGRIVPGDRRVDLL